MHSAKEKQEQVQSSRELALLTGKERDWLLGKLDLSKPYECRLKSSIKRKIRTFVDFELPLLIKNNLIISYEESRRPGFGDGTYYDNSSLGKAKVPGPGLDHCLQSLKSWKTYHDYMKKVFLESASVLSAGIVLLLLSTIDASAQPLVKDTPTGTLTDGSISISPEEPLPANGTVSISTEGVTDTNMNVIPPEGVSVVISSDSVTVTNQAVDIAGDEEQSDEDEGGNEGGDEGGDGVP